MMKNFKVLLLIIFCLLFSGQAFTAAVYIANSSQFPAYPYNTSAYKQSGAFVGCGPTAGAMILAYFQHVHSLSDLLTSPGSGTDEGLQTAWTLHGSQYMDTGSDGYGHVLNIKPGFENYAADHGHELQVTIHVSPTYSDPNASAADWLNEYGAFGDAWKNDGTFWDNSSGNWRIDPDGFCDFVDAKISQGITVFLTIDTDANKSGDHWVPLIGYNRSTGKYAYYDTYDTSTKWADIYYCNDARGGRVNSISMLRTVEYVGPISGGLPQPANLVALDGYCDAIPLAWSAPESQLQTARVPSPDEFIDEFPIFSQFNQSTTFDHPEDFREMADFANYKSPDRKSLNAATTPSGYNVYRSTSPTRGFEIIAKKISNQYYRDEDVKDGYKYYYKVTAVYSGSESDFSNAASATPSSKGYIINSGWATPTPTIDGKISSREWGAATAVKIPYPGISKNVTLYVMNDERYLYFAVDDYTDTRLDDDDTFGIFFDNDLDREWPSSASTKEGLLQLFWDAASNTAMNAFMGIFGRWPDKLQGNRFVSSSSTIQEISTAPGHLQYEGRIDLKNTPLSGNAGDKIGMLFYVWDGGNSKFTGAWPQETVNELSKIVTGFGWCYGPFAFGDLVLAEGAAEPDIAASPTSANYGNVEVGSYSDQTFVISNTGTATLSVSSTTLIGTHASEFSIQSGGGTFTVAAGASRNIIIRFSPGSTGSKTAALSISSNDPDENPLQINLSGAGIATPVLAVAPTTLNFGSTSNSMTFSISNTGNGTLSWTAAESPDKAWITSVAPASGTNNGTVTVSVNRDQLNSASDTGTLAVTSNGGNAEVTVLITKLETVSVPSMPDSPGAGKVEQSLEFTGNGAVSNFGHPVEYQFDWGDGTQSAWGAATQSHSYSSEGAKTIKARARCQTHTSVVSNWSAEKSVSITWCQLTINVSPPGSGTVTQSPDKTEYSWNELVTLIATPAADYRFDRWSGDLTGNENPKSTQLTDDQTITAHFVQLSTNPTHFLFTQTGESYPIVVNQIRLNETPLSIGDEIGVFTPAGLCVGASIWAGETPLSLIAWKDDTRTNSVVDGYRDGETMFFRIWHVSSVESREYPVKATYFTGNGTFGDGLFSILSLFDVSTQVEHRINLKPGWNWISTNVNPDIPQVEAIFSATPHLDILANGEGSFYIPAVVNGIGDWQVREGYKVHVSADDQVTFLGQQVPAATPIALNSGWNFVAYLPEEPIPADTAMASIVSQLAIVKQDDGKFYIPGVINAIDKMQAGKGYQLYLNSTATLTYPANTGLSKFQQSTIATFSNSAGYFEFVKNTGESYAIVIDALWLDNKELAENSEVAVFVDNTLCIGAASWNGESPMALVAWADDPQTEAKDGYVTGETMTFKIRNSQDEKIYAAAAKYSFGTAAPGEGIYSRIEKLEATTETSVAEAGNLQPEKFRLLQNYPNPFNPQTNIEFQLPKASTVRISIFDLQGNEVCCLTEQRFDAGVHRIIWNACNRNGQIAATGMYFCRLEACDTDGKTIISTRKMILAK